MPLEDPNDPNVLARGKRMRKLMPHMHALHAAALARFASSLAAAPDPNQGDLPTDGSLAMDAGYVPTRSLDVVTLIHAQNAIAGA
jgi:hypothetical protein